VVVSRLAPGTPYRQVRRRIEFLLQDAQDKGTRAGIEHAALALLAARRPGDVLDAICAAIERADDDEHSLGRVRLLRECTHGDGCPVHPRTRALHNFDDEPCCRYCGSRVTLPPPVSVLAALIDDWPHAEAYARIERWQCTQRAAHGGQTMTPTNDPGPSRAAQSRGGDDL
jgi:hypothetical protein